MRGASVEIVIFFLSIFSSNAFSPRICSSSKRRSCSRLIQADSSTTAESIDDSSSIMDTSTLTLLEHVNLNVPNHDYIVPFYIELLGCGLDSRKGENLLAGSKTVWANCGASQFHLPYGEQAQVIPGHIGLWYDSLDGLRERLAKLKDTRTVRSFEISKEDGSIKLVDPYGNVFRCREGGESKLPGDWKQPLVTKKDTETFQQIATDYGCEASECRGISYVEFLCPPNTADKIALFYDSVLDATTSVIEHDSTKIAMIAFGDIDDQGKPAQSLLFRETTDTIPPYDGHHIAMYVGKSQADFEQAFKNAEMAGIVWVNPRFSDKAHTLQGAKQYKQFRFKDIVDMETGQPIFELEHEMRSVEHPAWPGPKLASG